MMKIRAVTTDKYGFKREIGATEIFEEIYGAQRVEASDKPVTESFLGCRSDKLGSTRESKKMQPALFHSPSNKCFR